MAQIKLKNLDSDISADRARLAQQGYVRHTTYMFLALLTLTAVMLIALEYLAGDLNF